jgi:hypothetical protein
MCTGGSCRLSLAAFSCFDAGQGGSSHAQRGTGRGGRLLTESRRASAASRCGRSWGGRNNCHYPVTRAACPSCWRSYDVAAGDVRNSPRL